MTYRSVVLIQEQKLRLQLQLELAFQNAKLEKLVEQDCLLMDQYQAFKKDFYHQYKIEPSYNKRRRAHEAIASLMVDVEIDRDVLAEDIEQVEKLIELIERRIQCLL